MSAHSSSHGSSKKEKEKEKARFEAQKQRARAVQQKPDIITPSSSYPLFGAPKKVDTPDESSQKIQRVLGKYNEVRPFENTGPIIGVSPSTPSTPIAGGPKHGFFSSGPQRVNGQHKQSDSSGRKPDSNRSFNIPNAHSSSRDSSSSNTRKSLPHFPPSSSHPSHDRSKSRSPVKVHPFSHSSPAKPANSRPSVSPVTTQKPKKLSLDSYRAGMDAANHKGSTHNTSTISQESKSPTDHQHATHNSMKPPGKGPVTPPNGIVSENARSGVHRPPKLVIPDTQSKKPDILDEIFDEMTIQPPLTGIHTPRKTEDKFPFPTTAAPITAHKTSKIDDIPNIVPTESEVKEDKPAVTTCVTKSPPEATVESKPKPDLAERRGGTTAMKPSNINRTSASSSSDSSSSGSESGSDSDSNNSGSDSDSDDDEDEEEEQEKEKEKEEKEKDESKEKEEIKKDLDKSVDSTSSTESQPNQPKWSLKQFINKSKTSPLSNTSTGSKPSGGSKIDEENSAMLDDLVTSKSLKDIGPSSTLPFDIPMSSDSDDNVTLPGYDADRIQNGENSENEICRRNSCSPSALSSSSSDSDTCDVSMSKTTGKHPPVKRQRQSSSNKSTIDKVKKDGKSLKKSHSSVNSVKPPESKHKVEKKRKLTSTKRKKNLSREMIDSDSDIDVDVVSVTPDTKLTAPMSSNFSDHNQNDKLSITKQLFSSPKNSHDSSDSKHNNSQSSSGKPSKSSRHKDDVEHKKHLYKKNHKDNVKIIKPEIYKSSDEDESTDCAQDVEEIFESTEDFRPPSLHSPLPSYPLLPCKNITSPSTDNKSLALQELSIKSLPSQKSTKSPISKHDIKNQIIPSKTDESIMVKINLSLLLKNLRKEPVKKSESEPIKKLTKEKKESSANVDVKSSENSSGKENVKKSKKVNESVDDSVSVKKEVINVMKPSPVKVTKKEPDSVKQSTNVKTESESVSKKSSKSSESTLSKEDVKKDKDSSSSKKESKETRTKETKASKRKSETSLSNDSSAKKHKSSSSNSTSSKTSSSSSHSTLNSKKSSSHPTENGIDIDTEDEKRPPSRNERRNSTSSTSSRHSNKSNQSKKPKLESKSTKESSSDKTKKASTPVHQNGIESNNHHIPFSKYSDNRVPSSPAKTPSSSSKPHIKIEEHSVDHYLTKGKELKHKADPLRDKHPLQSFYTYTEAVLAYIQGAYSMEQKKTEPQRVFTLYTETLHLLRWFTSNIKLESVSHDKKLSGLILRIQSILYLKMYYLKKNEGLKFKKIIESHEQNKVTKAPHAPSPHQGWNRSTGIPSPMSPTPSPAGSIGSVGSQGSCELSANKPNGTASLAANSAPMASPGSVSIPQRIHSVTQQYITISGYLVNARELWDKAEIIAKECHTFFDYLNKQAGPLVYTPNSSSHLVHYVQKGLQCLKDT